MKKVSGAGAGDAPGARVDESAARARAPQHVVKTRMPHAYPMRAKDPRMFLTNLENVTAS
jgi:hypothetical protein